MTVTREKPKPGEKCFEDDSGILIPFVPASSKGSTSRSKASPTITDEQAKPTMTEEQIQAEMKRMKEAGYGTAEIAFAEEAMRGLEGKPKGSA